MWGLERHQRSLCALYCLPFGDSGSSRRIASGNLTRSGLGTEHCFNWISMAAGARAALHLCTATARNGCERPCRGAVEHGSREGGWLAFAHRRRSPPTLPAEGTRIPEFAAKVTVINGGEDYGHSATL